MGQWWRNDANSYRLSAERRPKEAQWRISIARVTAPSLFSRLPDTDRLLMLLGGGLRLSVKGRAPIVLSVGDPAYGFAGDVETSGEPEEDVAVNLNVTAHRSAFKMTCRHAIGRTRLDAPIVVIVALQESEAVIDGQAFGLMSHDALRIHGARGAMLHASKTVALTTISRS